MSCRTYGKGPLGQRERKPVAVTSLGILFDWQQGIFYIHYPTERIVHTIAFVLLAGMRNSFTGIDLTIHHTISGRSTMELYLVFFFK